MTEKQTGGSAFPGFHPPPGCRYQEEGMTLRDYFAAKAMQALVSSPNATQEWINSHLTTSAWAMADSMLKARDGQP